MPERVKIVDGFGRETVPLRGLDRGKTARENEFRCT